MIAKLGRAEDREVRTDVQQQSSAGRRTDRESAGQHGEFSSVFAAPAMAPPSLSVITDSVLLEHPHLDGASR
jgi:hypothetical protein